jgi:putative hydrolase of the HAD superfamily
MIFFDIDDTLITHSQSQKQAALLFWDEFADELAYSKQEFPAVWDAVMQKHFATFAAGQISFSEHRLRRMQEIFNTKNQAISDEEAEAHFLDYLRHYEESWALFDDVFPCLNALGGHSFGIISNGNGIQQRRKLERLGIRDRFSMIVISEEVGVWKPKQEIFLEACKKVATNPESCLYIGDNFTIDAQASQDAGMRGIWLNRNQLPLSKSAIPVISSLTELVAMV